MVTSRSFIGRRSRLNALLGIVVMLAACTRSEATPATSAPAFATAPTPAATMPPVTSPPDTTAAPPLTSATTAASPLSTVAATAAPSTSAATPSAAAATTAAPSTIGAATTTAAVKVTDSASVVNDVATAKQFFVDYLWACGGRDYKRAWSMLDAGYQEQIGGRQEDVAYNKFVEFWSDIDVVGTNKMEPTVREDSISFDTIIWYQYSDGSRKLFSETVSVTTGDHPSIYVDPNVIPLD